MRKKVPILKNDKKQIDPREVLEGELLLIILKSNSFLRALLLEIGSR